MSSVLHLPAFFDAVSSAEPSASDWRPLILQLQPGERGALADLCAERRISMLDPIARQVAELASVRLPSGGVEERTALADRLVTQAGDAASYGNWIYFPWESRIVHLLGRDDYFDVITSRNQNKITRAEQLRLREMRVGVVGLSVGGEAAVTVAQEHLCGHMVLADFDRLDLSNLNRLDAGCDGLGVNKAVLVARRILRIDPYFELTVLEDGVTAQNLEHFMGGLDLLIEECDSPEIKVATRASARKHGINLVFAADERGFLSVEPYGYWPDLELFHGRINVNQPPRDAYATQLSFFRALTDWMGGWDNISARSRQSLEQVGATLCGYPQLATEARTAASQIGHVARRLLLGERLPPFFGNIELGDLLPGAGS